MDYDGCWSTKSFGNYYYCIINKKEVNKQLKEKVKNPSLFISF